MSFYKIRPRSGTADQWRSANPVLAEREIGFEVPNEGIGAGIFKMKMGDGMTPWNELPYGLPDYNEVINEAINEPINELDTKITKVSNASYFNQVGENMIDNNVTNMLLVGLSDSHSNYNKRSYIHVDASTLTNSPIKEGTFACIREVFWLSNKRAFVRLSEIFPTPGRIWTNCYEQTKWTGWKSITPV